MVECCPVDEKLETLREIRDILRRIEQNTKPKLWETKIVKPEAKEKTSCPLGRSGGDYCFGCEHLHSTGCDLRGKENEDSILRPL